MKRQWNATRLALAAFTLFVLAGCGLSVSDNAAATAGRASPELGGATPEAVVERIRRAAENQDLNELAASIDPAELGELAQGLAFISVMTVAFSAMGDDEGANEAAAERSMQELEAIITRFGLPSMDDGPGQGGGPALQEALAELSQLDMIHLIADLGAFLDSLAEGEEGLNSEFLPPFEDELRDLVIDGDSARASIGDEEIAFVQVNQRWYARLPEPPAQTADDGV